MAQLSELRRGFGLASSSRTCVADERKRNILDDTLDLLLANLSSPRTHPIGVRALCGQKGWFMLDPPESLAPNNRILAILSRGQRALTIPGVSKGVPPNNNTNNIRLRPRLFIKTYSPLKWL